MLCTCWYGQKKCMTKQKLVFERERERDVSRRSYSAPRDNPYTHSSVRKNKSTANHAARCRTSHHCNNLNQVHNSPFDNLDLTPKSSALLMLISGFWLVRICSCKSQAYIDALVLICYCTFYYFYFFVPVFLTREWKDFWRTVYGLIHPAGLLLFLKNVFKIFFYLPMCNVKTNQTKQKANQKNQSDSESAQW